MKRGTALRLYRNGETCGPDEASHYEVELEAWIEGLLSFSPSGRLEIVQAINASRELVEISCPIRLAGVHSVLLAAARAVRNRDQTAALFLRSLPSIALQGTPTYAVLTMVARAARPVLVA